MKIDTHQHFWQYQAERDQWITEDMSVIRRDFMPVDLAPILRRNHIDGCISVQADQSDRETRFLLDLADKHGFIKGVVGWIDLKSPDLEQQLLEWKAYPLLKGFRHILQAEKDEFMLEPAFVQGLHQLHKRAFTYDILVYHHQLPAVAELVRALPQMKLVIDHFAKPDLKQNDHKDWLKHMKSLASYEHIFVKLSGLITEADWKNWKKEHITPLIREIIQIFGPHRVMYGSDWPVCLLAGSYNQVLELAHAGMGDLSTADRDKVMGKNAIQFYNIK